MIIMVLGGLWHGANWTFILWGAFHGGIMVIERAFGIRGETNKPMSLKRFAAIIMTFILVVIGWVMFRADNVSYAIDMYRGMIGLNGFDISLAYAWQIKGVAVTALIAGFTIIVLTPLVKLKNPKGMLPSMALLGLFLLAVSRLIAQSYSPFLYFQF